MIDIVFIPKKQNKLICEYRLFCTENDKIQYFYSKLKTIGKKHQNYRDTFQKNNWFFI